jgi:beta-glucosidase
MTPRPPAPAVTPKPFVPKELSMETPTRTASFFGLVVVATAAAMAAVRCVPPRAGTAPDRSRGRPDRAAGEPPAYLNPDLPFETRAADLVGRMTVDEKISQLLHEAAAIPRLGIPQYNWWNECLHGVARAGLATVFPQAIGMAASFDVPLMGEVATAIGDEARAKHHEFVRQGQRGIFQGLTFWSPNINIFRDPRWGRGQETYGEDPYLTARMGVAFVNGLQGDDPKYYKVIATAKHFAVHSGPEPDRHHFDAQVSERDLHETYLPAFRALVEEAKVASVMGAYNRVNGEPASASQRLLGDTLRGEWHFGGYVVSDCGAIEDMYRNHKIVGTPAAAAGLALSRGCDLECGFQSAYRELGSSLEQGLVTESNIDVAVRRLMLARMKLGMFDPPERVPYARIPYAVNLAPEHDRLARRMAQASIVLLKNTGVLPLRKDLKTIAVIGPNADALPPLLGNYFGTPARPVTVLAGIKAAVPGTRVLYARGSSLVEGRMDPSAVEAISSEFLRPAAGSTERGLRGEYFENRDLAGAPALVRTDAKVDFTWYRGSPTDDAVARGELAREKALGNDDFSVRWTGELVPPVAGSYEVHVSGDDGYRLSVDGRLVIDDWNERRGPHVTSATLRLEAGRGYAIRLEYFEGKRDAEIHLGWTRPGARGPVAEALDAANAADAIVFVGGLSPEVEGEELPVSLPGFFGGDRTDIALPAPQERLLEALRATGKPVVLVLLTGSAIAATWAEAMLPAVLVAWYPGQHGDAVADVLFGDVSPAGRLPVTFYRSTDDLPPFAEYAMKERTYRYFTGQPLYPFGYGLSYTRFEYSDLQLDAATLTADQALHVSARVKNTGDRDGDEVVQLYVRDTRSIPAMALKALRGFSRIHLARGEQKVVAFELRAGRDLSHYDVNRHAEAVDPGEFEVQVGASSRDIRLTGRVLVR